MSLTERPRRGDDLRVLVLSADVGEVILLHDVGSP
jgi:hypothetical protein